MKQSKLIIDLSYFQTHDGNAMSLHRRIQELYATASTVLLQENGKEYTHRQEHELLYDVFNLLHKTDVSDVVCNDSTKKHWHTSWLFAIIMVLCIAFIPPLLNYLLITDSPYGGIIGGDRSSEIWLGFWGSFISAIAAAILSYVAVWQNQKQAQRDDRNREFDKACEEYQELERFVKEQHTLYSISNFCELGLELFKKDFNAITAMMKLRSSLEMSSISFVRFMDDFDENIKQYGSVLLMYNVYFMECLYEISKARESTTGLYEIINERVYDLQERLKKIDPLQQVGFNLLYNKRQCLLNLKITK